MPKYIWVIVTSVCLLTHCQFERFDVALDKSSEEPSLCGNGILEADEACDDGNAISETMCTYGTETCLSCNATCSSEIELVGEYCGDGILNPAEVCDDANIFDETECPYGFFDCVHCNSDCSENFIVLGRFCGDGVQDPEEVCDDGNNFTEAECNYGISTCFGCSEFCDFKVQLFGGYCGDGVCQNEEQELTPPCEIDCDILSGLPVCADSLSESFRKENIEAGAPLAEYTMPLSAVESLFSDSINTLLDSDSPQRAQTARGYIEQGSTGDVDYILCRDPNDPHVARWEPRVEGEGKSRIALRVKEARPATLSVPHALSETKVLEQSVRLFENLGLRALVISGAHRCANLTTSNCSGQTILCGEQGPYRSSDMGHVDDTIFQWFHEILLQQFPMDSVISLHEHAGAGLHLSNGTQLSTNPTSLVARLSSALIDDALFESTNILLCNGFEDSQLSTGFLCGTDNIQGRMVNFSDAPCSTSATVASEQFIHLTQSAEVLSNDQDKIELALSSVLDIVSVVLD